jgi:hypothetical protein
MNLKAKKILVDGKEFFIFLSNYAVNEFEKETGKKITDAGLTTETQLKLFFFCAKAGCLETETDFSITWDQFLNLPYLETIEKFSSAIYGKSDEQEPDSTKKK